MGDNWLVCADPPDGIGRLCLGDRVKLLWPEAGRAVEVYVTVVEIPYSITGEYKGYKPPFSEAFPNITYFCREHIHEILTQVTE